MFVLAIYGPCRYNIGESVCNKGRTRMDLKKLYIEHALYPAMALLQNNRVME